MRWWNQLVEWSRIMVDTLFSFETWIKSFSDLLEFLRGIALSPLIAFVDSQGPYDLSAFNAFSQFLNVFLPVAEIVSSTANFFEALFALLVVKTIIKLLPFVG